LIVEVTESDSIGLYLIVLVMYIHFVFVGSPSYRKSFGKGSQHTLLRTSTCLLLRTQALSTPL